MSYQHKSYGWIAVCDMCQEFGPIGDRALRVMKGGTAEAPIHLCSTCCKDAVWCDHHHQYHRAEAFHRCACVDCDGLYTSIVHTQIKRCPSCQRATGFVPTPSAPKARPQTLLGAVSHWLTHARRS